MKISLDCYEFNSTFVMVSTFPATGTQGLYFLYLPKYFVLLYCMGVTLPTDILVRLHFD